MKTAYDIEPPFEVPPGYRREFVLQGLGGLHERMLVDARGFHYQSLTDATSPAQLRSAGRVLDWIAESTAVVREELGV